MEGESDFRQWDELAPDLLGLVFKNLELRQILQVIPLVCKSWCKVVEGPYCWQRIDSKHWSKSLRESPNRMLQKLITRSSGSLLELIVYPVYPRVKIDQMFSFIADHAGSLQTLDIRNSSITESTFKRYASKFPSLTTLDISGCDLGSTEVLEAIGRNCKKLVSLTLDWHDSYKPSHEDEVWTIGSAMPKLKHLNIAFHILKTQDVLEILSGCPELESLDIIGCCLDADLDINLLEEKDPKEKLTIYEQPFKRHKSNYSFLFY